MRTPLSRLPAIVALFLALLPVCVLAHTRPRHDVLVAHAGKTLIIMTFPGETQRKPWCRKLLAVAKKWYPKICRMLPSRNFTPPRKFNIILQKGMKGVAYTMNDTVHLAAPYFKQNPGDLGVIVHEMTHVVQQYHHPVPWYFTEGIADWVRFYHYEPVSRHPHPNPNTAKYSDGYQTTAAFLNFLERKYKHHFVRKLNTVLRAGHYKPSFFKKRTGHSLPKLWQMYAKTLK